MSISHFLKGRKVSPAMEPSNGSKEGTQPMRTMTLTWRNIGGNLVLIYLAAIVSANLIITVFGPAWSILTAAVFIGLDLTSRDRLHEVWKGRWMVAKMGALIAVGSGLSYALNQGAGQIALASFVAFAASATLDAIVYAILGRFGWFARSNGSNVVGSAADSLIFPTLAFGGFMPLVTLGQFVAKVVGGFVWSLILKRAGVSLVNLGGAS